MGCLSDKSNLPQNSSQIDDFESYPEPDDNTFLFSFLKLSWKSKPNICIYQKLDEELLDKKEIKNNQDLLDFSQIEEIKLVPQLYEMKNILIYIYQPEGVVITGNMEKLNYYLSKNMKIILKICIVDISSIIMTGSEYNSIKEIKNQSKYYYELNLKEINFTYRNNLINNGKDEELSDTELNLDDEHLEEMENNKYEQHILTSEYEKDDEEEEFEYEYNENEKEISKLSIDKIANHKKEKLQEKNNIEYIETNANENNPEEKNKNIVENEENNKGFETKGNCLIISMSEMTDEIKRELKRLFFVSTIKDESPYLYEKFYNKEEEKKSPKSKKNQEIIFEEELNDYIQINRKNAISYEQRTQFHKITKIIFVNCTFSKESLANLKDFFGMLSFYKYLLKLSVYDNNDMDFSVWKFFKQLVRDNFNIRWISFRGANLNDDLFGGIIMGMTLKRIRYLNLSKNKITNKGLYFLNKFLMKNQTLLILDLSYNQNVTNEGIKLITNALKMHPNINKVDLSYMRLKGSGHYISSFIRDNKCLRSIFLKNCQFEKNDIEQFPLVFSQKDCKMEHLDLSLNSSVGEDGLKEIGKLITNNKSLISIGLDGMNLSMNNYMPVFQGILKNKTIKSYSLNINPGLPLKGILNFFLKNPNIKEISIIPWDYTKDKTKKFTDSQLQLFERFHKKAPDVIINGIYFD